MEQYPSTISVTRSYLKYYIKKYMFDDTLYRVIISFRDDVIEFPGISTIFNIVSDCRVNTKVEIENV